MLLQILWIVCSITYWAGCLYYEKKFNRLVSPEHRYYKYERFALTIFWPIVVVVSICYIILSFDNKAIISSAISDD